MSPDEGRTSSEQARRSAPHPETEAASPAPRKRAWPEIPGAAITAEIGVGGMGRVYRGRQSFVDREVAVKVIHATEDEAY